MSIRGWRVVTGSKSEKKVATLPTSNRPNSIPIAAQYPLPDSGQIMLSEGFCVFLNKIDPPPDDAPFRRAFDAPPGGFPYSRMDTELDDYDAKVTSRDGRPVITTVSISFPVALIFALYTRSLQKLSQWNTIIPK